MRREWTRGHVDTRATIPRSAKGEGRGAQLTCANRAGGTGAAVDWLCRLQSSTSLSSAESEFYLLSCAIAEAAYVRNMLSELGVLPVRFAHHWAGYSPLWRASDSEMERSWKLDIGLRRSLDTLRAASQDRCARPLKQP